MPGRPAPPEAGMFGESFDNDDDQGNAENENPQRSSENNVVLGDATQSEVSRSLRHDLRKGRRDAEDRSRSSSVEKKRLRCESVTDTENSNVQSSSALKSPGLDSEPRGRISNALRTAAEGLQKITSFFSVKSPEVSELRKSELRKAAHISTVETLPMLNVPSTSSISANFSKVNISPEASHGNVTKRESVDVASSSCPDFPSSSQAGSNKTIQATSSSSSLKIVFKTPIHPVKERSRKSMCTRSSPEQNSRKQFPISSTSEQKSSQPKKRSSVLIIDRVRSKSSQTLYHMSDETLENSDESSEPDEVVTEKRLSQVPTMIVVDPSIDLPTRFNERIEIVKEFVPSLPKECPEARRGELYGTWSRRRERKKIGEKWEEDYPGIPDLKYGSRDEQKMNKADREALNAAENKDERKRIQKSIDDRPWIVQALFECPDDPERSLVLYEGWSSESMTRQRTDETISTAPKSMEVRRIREAFLNKVKQEATVKARELGADGSANSFVSAVNTFFTMPEIESLGPTSRYWLYRDLEYFHTKHQEEHLLGPIWYMSMSDPEQLPPRYTYTSVNIVDKAAFDKCRSSLASLSTDKLISKFYSNHTFYPGANETCSNPKGCRCNQRFNILYGRDSGQERRLREGYQPIKNLKHDNNGLLDLCGFKYHDARVIMECSDECGCNHECPRRRLQKGQSKPMVVYHEGEKGFGLRAAESFKKGELVCEYTGNMFLLDTPLEQKPVPLHAQQLLNMPSIKKSKKKKKGGKDDEDRPKKRQKTDRSTSYQAGFYVMSDEIAVCAGNFGNIGRFINHSCDPNTAFFEVHSRRYVSDPLIPRVAVYATKDIALGEEITIAYWEPSKERARTGMPCRCGSSKCMKYLPY